MMGFEMMGSPRLLLSTSFLLATLSGALAAPPYEGRWTENPAWCRNTSGTDELPITITRRSIDTFASSCRVLSVKRVAAEWRIRTSCRDEGQDATEPRVKNTFVLRLAGDRMTMRDMNGMVTLTRCPR
jgi:hypothetical protein